jgi:3-dehydroquinate synthase
VVEVEVPLAGRRYPVFVGAGARQRLPALVAQHGRAAMLADRAVDLPPLEVPTLAIPGGEGSKTMATLGRVLDFMEEAGVARDGCLVVCGGGSIGDLGGLAASLWQRGVVCYQVPTTLLAMVDSSVGGKTGVNTRRAKNAIGTFWQPAAVVADLDYLRTLPASEFESAFGEVVKYAVAMDASLARLLRRDRERLLARDAQALEPVVKRCVELKASVVAEDERDQGPRAILNYGHTVAHALEAASGFAAVHGRAVSQGMRVAARISARSGLCDTAVVDQQDELLEAFGLPGRLPHVDVEQVLAALPRDKKSRAGSIEWVLPRSFGRAEPGHRVEPETVRAALAEILA